MSITTKTAVTYGLDRASFNQGKGAMYDFAVEDEISPPLVARGPGAVCTALTSADLSVQEITKALESNM